MKIKFNNKYGKKILPTLDNSRAEIILKNNITTIGYEKNKVKLEIGPLLYLGLHLASDKRIYYTSIYLVPIANIVTIIEDDLREKYEN